jgi:GrpB-like predicted nucleotidyltransferase (UPF0157 family)
MAGTVKKITQSELAEYVKLEVDAGKFKKLRGDIISRWAKKADIESGELSLSITQSDGKSVSYAGAIKEFLKDRPALVKAFDAVKRKFTKPKASHEVVVTGAESI